MARAEENTRDRLLDAAENLFGERSFAAVGIREIADHAGVNLSGIKYHFGSKWGLYLETVRRSMERRGSSAAWSLLEDAPPSPQHAALLLRDFIGAFLRVILGPEDSGSCACLVMHAALEPGEGTDLIVQEFVRPHHERLCALVAVLCPAADASERSRYAQCVMAQLIHQRLFRAFIERIHPAPDRGEAEIERIADEITAFSLRGMGCPLETLAPLHDAAATGDTE
ncbi:MAG: CerR family C-terminal domain-containing protein [Phycisphaerales bacterium]|nr:CerR family C-terminal domain-containing protein [Phycisphaerales bacterium]